MKYVFHEYKIKKDDYILEGCPTLMSKKELKKSLKETGYKLVPFSYKKCEKQE